MNIRIKKENLLKVLSKVQTIADKRSTMAILSNVLLTAEDEKLSCIATDLEVSYKGFCIAEIEKPGQIAISARKFYEIIKEFPREDILLREKSTNRLLITSEDSKILYTLSGYSAEDFPSIPSTDGVNTVSIEKKLLKEMIEKTIFCVSTEETRFTLSGIFIHKINNKLRFVASDGHRLALIDRDIENLDNLDVHEGIILPKKAAQEIKKLADSDGIFLLGIKDNHFFISNDQDILIVRLIEGQYPDYQAVIPETKERIVSVDKIIFLDTLKRVSILSPDRFKSIKLSITNNQMVVSSVYSDIGEAQEIIDVSYTGDDFEIGFNAKYLIDICSSMVSDVIDLIMNSPSSPALILGPEDYGYLGIIMPIKLND